MKTYKTLSLVVLLATLGTAGVVLAKDMAGMPGMKMDDKPMAPASQPATQSGAVDLGNTLCPVSGDKVGDSKLTETYEGKIYHFCCADCPTAFKKDPAKYAQAVSSDPAKYGVMTSK